MSALSIQQVPWSSHREQLLAVRHEVFVVEQQVPADKEADDLDPQAVHFLATDSQGTPIGTARVLSDGHIGRVAVRKDRRGQGIGRALTEAAIRDLKERQFASAMLNAQLSVVKFYEKLGFESHGEVFEECGISHIAMQLPLGTDS